MKLSGYPVLAVALAALCAHETPAQTPTTNPAPGKIWIQVDGGITNAFVRRAGATVWDPVYDRQQLLPGDRLQTREHARLMLVLPDGSTMRVGELSDLEIQAEPATRSQLGLLVRRARLYFFHRGDPTDLRIRTRTASAAVRGTEFNLEANEEAELRIAVFDGQVLLSNDVGEVLVQNDEQGVAIPGRPPTKTAVIQAVNIIQWCLYYPAVLDVEELDLPAEAKEAVSQSLEQYRAGDLLKALAAYPTGRQPNSPDETLYYSALLLSVGKVAEAEVLLTALETAVAGRAEAVRVQQLAGALRKMVAAVKGQQFASEVSPELASEWLAESYYRQAHLDLEGALKAARHAIAVSPQFGFAWARVAELEFSFGRTRKAQDALNRALELSPRNAQALALKGFVLAARNKIGEALKSFDAAIAVDNALGNAWLGRGLCRIYQGKLEEGVGDLQVAVTMEPQRAILRSYLGKGWAHKALYTRTGATRARLRLLAEAELERAKKQDPFDPTPWLYSALMQHDGYRTAEAIRDLEESQRLNDNRAVYRSRLLLDQDQAVRSANLGHIFEDAGMRDVGLRESARAVSFDYANYSAHLNLASSFNQMRDPTRFNLRFETEWFNEHLLASLLAPVGAGSLSQNLSQQEYARLFAGKRFGLNGTTEYFSDGEWRQTASHFGTFGGTSYALDLDYLYREGVRPNNDLSRIEWYSRIKQQITPQDSALLLVKYQDYESGDNFQYYNPDTSARRGFRLQNKQAPLLLAGWHHEWSPGVHTLFLGGRLVNDQHARDTNSAPLVAMVNPLGAPTTLDLATFDMKYRSEFETYTAELNQIFQRERHTDIFGLRYQNGDFDADASLDNPPPTPLPLFAVPVHSVTDADFRRLSLYAYHHWEIIDHLLLIGGVAYDTLDYPANFRRPPLESREAHKKHWSPKAALIWDLSPQVRLRGVFSQAVGGVSYDESIRLEPTQLAGFGQSFRSLISESLVGSVEAPEYQIVGGALDFRPSSNTWLSLQAQVMREEVTRDFGLFTFNWASAPPFAPTNSVERLDYHEWQVRGVLNQILGREWFLEVQYQFTRSELERGLPTIPATSTFDRTTMWGADLHQFGLAAMWRSPEGFFARGELWWFAQDLSGDGPHPPSDSFPQVNLYSGYRFPERRAELTVGILNLTGEDYALSPLNYYLEMPRERVFYLRFRFNF